MRPQQIFFAEVKARCDAAFAPEIGLRVTDQALAGNVFPGSADVKAMEGLV